jgi:hypothetical protein
MKKSTIIVITVILSVPLIIMIYLLFPVKYALKQKDLDVLEKPYFFIKWTQVTGSSWRIVGDQDGYYDRSKYIITNGGGCPHIVGNYDIARADNTYICYGYYIGEGKDYGGPIFSEYQCTGWDILYPVKRDAIIPFWPKSYLSRLDFYFISGSRFKEAFNVGMFIVFLLGGGIPVVFIVRTKTGRRLRI